MSRILWTLRLCRSMPYLACGVLTAFVLKAKCNGESNRQKFVVTEINARKVLTKEGCLSPCHSNSSKYDFEEIMKSYYSENWKGYSSIRKHKRLYPPERAKQYKSGARLDFQKGFEQKLHINDNLELSQHSFACVALQAGNSSFATLITPTEELLSPELMRDYLSYSLNNNKMVLAPHSEDEPHLPGKECEVEVESVNRKETKKKQKRNKEEREGLPELAQGSMSRQRDRPLPRRNSTRGHRDQFCFELRGTQALPRSLSVPPSLHPTRPPSQSSTCSHSRTISRSHSEQVLGYGTPTKTSKLRVHTAPVGYTAPDYRHLARRQKQFTMVRKTVSADKTLQTMIPEGETLHSFLIGGRYNSARYLDSRSLQRLGVYVPRNNTAKMFINPAGTTPPSPAIYGIHPLKKHIPRIFPPPSPPPSSLSRDNHHSPAMERYMGQDLERHLSRGSTDCWSPVPKGANSLTAACQRLQDSGRNYEQEKLWQKDYGDNSRQGLKSHLVMEDSERSQSGQKCISRNPVSSDSRTVSGTERIRESGVTLKEGGERATLVGDGEKDSEGRFAVSGLYLLSPEAQLLTQEILLETESVCSQYSTSHARGTGPPLVRNDHSIPVLRSELAATSPQETSRHQSAEKPSKPDQTSRHELSDQTARHQLTEPTCTCNHTTAKHSSPHTQEPTPTDQIPSTRGRRLSDTVGISQHHSTSILTRPHSAAPRQKVVTVRPLPKAELLTRPKSAVEMVHRKTTAAEKGRLHSVSEKSTIFVDLSKLHPLHVDTNDNTERK